MKATNFPLVYIVCRIFLHTSHCWYTFYTKRYNQYYISPNSKNIRDFL